MRIFTTPKSRRAPAELPIYGAADSTQKQKSGGGGEDTADAKSGDGSKKLAKKGEELKEEMDELLDEIDNVLE